MIYKPTPGEDITHACKTALKIANSTGETVAFKFNDVQMIARPGEHHTLLRGYFYTELHKQAEAYRASPEGIAAASKSEREAVEKQARIDQMVTELPSVIESGLDSTVAWCGGYSLIADDNRINAHRDTVLLALLSAGYINNEFTGNDWIAGNKTVMGRWIIGQCINCMSKGMPPPPMAAHFAGVYAEAPK